MRFHLIVFPILMLVICLSNFKLLAQSEPHTHERLFMNFSGGIAGGNIKSKVESFTLETYGTAFAADFRMGGFVSKRVALCVGTVFTRLAEPRAVLAGYGATDKVKGLVLKEYFFGGGLSWFSNYKDVSLSLLSGPGYVVVEDTKKNTSNTSDTGFSFQLKAVKDFWIAPQATIGLGIMYMKSIINNEGIEKISSNRFAVSLVVGID